MKATWIVAPLLAGALLVPPAVAPAMAAVSVVASRNETVLAPGVTLANFERLYPFGWVRGYLVTADLTQPGISADLVSAGAVTAARPPSDMAAQAGAVAAINGDFFDINNTKLPLGPEVQGGLMLKSAPAGSNAVGVGADRIGRLMDVALSGNVTLPGGTYPLASLNQYTVPEGGIGLYTAQWTVSRTGAAFGAATVREVIVRGGVVTAVADSISGEPAPADGFILVGREGGAAALAGLKPGDRVTVGYGPKADAGGPVRFALGGGAVLVRNGQVMNLDDRYTGPRSAIGFADGGTKMLLLAVDGRSETSGGLTLQELARLMRELGAVDALELDGGGSTALVARRPGDTAVQVQNQPSDGAERRVPDGVGVFAAPGSGQPAALTVTSRLGVSQWERVFPGLHRSLGAVAHDEQMGHAAAGPVTWGATGGSVGSDGIFQAGGPGSVTVTARAGSVTGTAQVRVLGPLVRVGTDLPDGLRLNPGETATVHIYGYDADGYRAPLESTDVTPVWSSPDLAASPGADGGFRVTMLRDGSARVAFAVQGKFTVLQVAAGSLSAPVDAMEGTGGWHFDRSSAAVTGALAGVPGRTGQGMQLSYTLGAGSTRAAYVVAPDTLVLPEGAEGFGLWVKGDGQGAWLRATVADSKGTTRTLDLAKSVTWTDWRAVEAALPTDLTPPVRLVRIYAVETNSARLYSGRLVFDDLAATATRPMPSVLFRAPEGFMDPTFAPGPAGGWRFAVLPAPLAGTDAALQGQLRSALAAGAQFVVMPGAAATDLQRAVKLTTLPVYGLQNLPPALNGVRLVGLQAGAAPLWKTDFDRLAGLQGTLEQAAADPAVQGVLLVGDVTPDHFADGREAQLMQGWLTGFRAQAGGKAVAYLAGGAGQSITRVEGVPYISAGTPGTGVLVQVGQGGAASPWLHVTPLPAK